MLVIQYFSPDGRMLDFASREGPFIVADGMPELVGKFSRAVTVSAGRPGGVPQDVSVDPFEVVLACYIKATTHRSMEQEYARFRNMFHTDVDGQLQVRSHSFGTLSTPVRLGAPLPAPGVLPGVRDHEEVDLPLWGRDGCFWSGWREETFEGNYTRSVTVTNPGDVWAWPEFVWDSSQPSWVTFPSGAQVTLPRMPDGARLTLRMSRHVVSVVDAEGEKRRDALTLVGNMWPEGVPPRSSREFKVLSGSSVTMRWRSGHLDPWR